MRLMWLLILMLIIGAPVAAQERGNVAAPVVKKLVISDAAMAPAFADAGRGMMQQRDSLKNGTIIGAVGAGIGAAAGAGVDALVARSSPMPIIRVRF